MDFAIPFFPFPWLFTTAVTRNFRGTPSEHHQNTGTGQGLHFTRDQSPNKPSELLRCPHNNAESLHLNAKAIVSFPSKIIKVRSQKDQLVAVQTFVELSVQKPKVENERRAQPFSDLLEAAKQI